MKIKTSLTITTLGIVSSVLAGKPADEVFVGPPNPVDFENGLGRVDTNFYMQAYEVSNTDYLEFLNSVAKADPHDLYDEAMTLNALGGILQSGSSGTFMYLIKPGFDNHPVNFVSFWDAARYANWLTNGCPVGPQDASTTESGVYNLNGITDPENASVPRDEAAWAAGGYALPTLDEFYKAGFHDPTAPETGYYWDYATRSDDRPANEILDPDPGNSQNHRTGTFSPSGFTDVGEFENSPSYYGTFDQGGNAEEWLDDIPSTNSRRVAGGSYASNAPYTTIRFTTARAPGQGTAQSGFRLVRLALWAGFPVHNAAADVNTGPWLNWINASSAPWIYSYALDGWLFTTEAAVTPNGGWLFVQRE